MVRYRLWVDSEAHASAAAAAIAREQTVEVPHGVGGAELQARLLGRVGDVADAGEGRFDVSISYPLEVVGTQLPQLVNVAYGNVSLMNGVRVVDVELPAAALEALPGPRLGIEGLRALVGAGQGRPLVSVAIKPVGRTAAELAELAVTFVRAGVDVIKDDHGLVDQSAAPFAERVQRVGAAVHEENARLGRRCAYFPNVTGPVDGLARRLEVARAADCPGVVLCPGLLGLDVMRSVASGSGPVAIMAHPSHAQTAPGRREGIAPDVLLGVLYRVAGADAVVYVNALGRFSWPVQVCERINERLRAPLGALRPSFPVPAGGVRAEDAGRWLERYGADTMLLIGGSLLGQDDLLGATRRVVEAAHAVDPAWRGVAEGEAER